MFAKLGKIQPTQTYQSPLGGKIQSFSALFLELEQHCVIVPHQNVFERFHSFPHPDAPQISVIFITCRRYLV